MAAFLSGEMRDTVNVSPAASYILEHFFSKRDRAKLFRSWAGSASMWIKARYFLIRLTKNNTFIIGRRYYLGERYSRSR